MCRPVRVKNDAPNSGAPQGFLNGVTPEWIRCSHSFACRTTNATPPAIVASSHFTHCPRFPRWAAATAITIVTLDDSRQNVIMVENVTAGYISNGVGQFGFAIRE